MAAADDLAARLCGWLRSDAWRMARLAEARALALPDWWLAAGFVRNAVWDRLHGHAEATPLNDIDLIYCDPEAPGESRDRALSERLRTASGQPWSVKNQARMHQRHGHAPYDSATQAMRFWVECETAVAVRLEADGALTLSAPLGLDSLMAGRISHNPQHDDAAVFERRIAEKRWLERWPRLQV
ncbi:nucleotidyltransferase family protein [Salinicola halophilus]|uniref:nucleotidyltransferase family protein n=1 Tax=Salinicola halophilus TaxID=184065 RepID=UPI000DA236BF|nr:nucleotidyltransferase family protein [Salinicola halophilus]